MDRAKVILASLASLILVSWIDWVTGYEFLFFVFYFVPVAICAWHLGRVSTLAISFLCGVSWVVVDWLSAHHYTVELLRYGNGLTCFLAFAIIGLVVNSLRRSMRELAQALEDVKRTSEEVRKLQSQLQVVCAWTKRIRIDGKWLSLEQFLASKLNVQVSHGISPEAFQEIKKSLE
jgi:hypothetical protein